MVGSGAFIRIDAHEQLARLGKLSNELAIMCNELLHWLIVAEITKVAENRHESLGFERETINIDLRIGIRRIYDVFAFDLVCKESSDDRQKTRNDIMMANNVYCHGRDCKQLKGEIFDGGFCL